jgi:hypothetical protein
VSVSEEGRTSFVGNERSVLEGVAEDSVMVCIDRGISCQSLVCGGSVGFFPGKTR